jgi:hypothetical protein
MGRGEAVMRLTQTHIDYWNERHQPAWANRVQAARQQRALPCMASDLQRVSVHDCVNAHADWSPLWINGRMDCDRHNHLVYLKRRRRKPGELRETLRQEAREAVSAGRGVSRRAANALKWLRRLEEGW